MSRLLDYWWVPVVYLVGSLVVGVLIGKSIRRDDPLGEEES